MEPRAPATLAAGCYSCPACQSRWCERGRRVPELSIPPRTMDRGAVHAPMSSATASFRTSRWGQGQGTVLGLGIALKMNTIAGRDGGAGARRRATGTKGNRNAGAAPVEPTCLVYKIKTRKYTGEKKSEWQPTNGMLQIRRIRLVQAVR